jgi:hypothetical protein
MNRLLAATGLLLSLAPASFAQQFPVTLPPNTVIGRLATTGPAEAIPFAVFTGGMFAAVTGDCTFSSSPAGVITCTKINSNAVTLSGPLTTSGSAGILRFSYTGSPTLDIANPTFASVTGGISANSTLVLQSTSGTGTTDSILFKTGAQVTSWSMETLPGSNTYTPVSGSVAGALMSRVGTSCATTGVFTTPGIGPAPSTGHLFACGDYADSTAGNISNIFSVAYNSGTRFTAATTGVGVLKAGTTGGNAWGGQFSAIAQGNGTGILQGANIEADYSTGAGITAIALTLKLGDSAGGVTVNPGNSYINMLADTGKTPVTGIRFQASAFTSANTQSILNVEGGSAVNGINLSGATFTSCVFKGPNSFCVYNNGGVQTGSTTVGALPTCNAGLRATRLFVTDSNSVTFFAIPAGGSGNTVAVFCDGAAWRVG